MKQANATDNYSVCRTNCLQNAIGLLKEHDLSRVMFFFQGLCFCELFLWTFPMNMLSCDSFFIKLSWGFYHFILGILSMVTFIRDIFLGPLCPTCTPKSHLNDAQNIDIMSLITRLNTCLFATARCDVTSATSVIAAKCQ